MDFVMDDEMAQRYNKLMVWNARQRAVIARFAERSTAEGMLAATICSPVHVHASSRSRPRQPCTAPAVLQGGGLDADTRTWDEGDDEEERRARSDLVAEMDAAAAEAAAAASKLAAEAASSTEPAALMGDGEGRAANEDTRTWDEGEEEEERRERNELVAAMEMEAGDEGEEEERRERNELVVPMVMEGWPPASISISVYAEAPSAAAAAVAAVAALVSKLEAAKAEAEAVARAALAAAQSPTSATPNAGKDGGGGASGDTRTWDEGDDEEERRERAKLVEEEESKYESDESESDDGFVSAPPPPRPLVHGLAIPALSLGKLKQMVVPPDEAESKADKLRRFAPICSKILEGLYLGSDVVARSRSTLHANGITHVLNCAGVACLEYHAPDSTLTYRTLFLYDSPQQELGAVLYESLAFIADALASGGKVFVHCQQGVSRSASLVIAYVMWTRGLNFLDAHTLVKEARGVAEPNAGFVCALVAFGKRLRARPLTAPSPTAASADGGSTPRSAASADGGSAPPSAGGGSSSSSGGGSGGSSGGSSGSSGSSGSQEVQEMRVYPPVPDASREMRVYRMVPHYNGPAPREVELSWARVHQGDATAELGEHLDPRSAFVVHLPPRSAAAVPGAHSLTPNGSRAAANAGADVASAAEAEAEAEPNATAEDPLAAYRGQCIVLYTSYASNMLFEVAWRKLETQIQGMGLKYTAVDGAAPDAKAVRSVLWAISNDRSYPQVFACRHGGACEFVGGASEMQALFDSGEHVRRLAEYLELPSEIPQGGGPIHEVGGFGSGLGSSSAGACFVWVGAQSCNAYRLAALRWAALLERFEGAPPAHEEVQGRESEPFWRAVSCSQAVPGRAFVAVRKATPLAAYDAEYGPGIATFLPKPVPALSLSPAEGAPSPAEGTLARDAATGDIVGPQQRWHAALNALLFVHHLSSY